MCWLSRGHQIRNSNLFPRLSSCAQAKLFPPAAQLRYVKMCVRMFRIMAQVVVVLTLVAVVAIPVIGLHCDDGCPPCGRDSELQAISILSCIGMLLLFAALLSLTPGMTSCGLFQPPAVKGMFQQIADAFRGCLPPYPHRVLRT